VQSCSYLKPKKKDNKDIIAKVNDVFLYKDDVKSLLPSNYTKNDSALLVTNYINSWAKRQLLFSKAKINLNENQLEIRDLVDQYHQDLLINKYKEAVVAQDLDTIISQNDIEIFYKENKEIFKLNEKLIKLKYLQISQDVIDIKEMKQLFLSNDEEDIIELKNNELVFKSSHFNDSIWIKYSDVIKLIPIVKEIENKIGNGKFFEKKDVSDIYFIKIVKTLNRNRTAPKSYVEPTIKQMILHNRKLLLLKEIEKTLLNDATKNGNFETYK
jgi:hypothetical protein